MHLRGLVILAAFLSTAASAQTTTIYVSEHGRDVNPGTAAEPLASLEGARQRVRALARMYVGVRRGNAVGGGRT